MEQDKPKMGWGGRRANQHGRPPMPPELRRVRLQARVSPQTKEWLDGQSESTGKIIDKMVVKNKKS